ncbi:MAG: ATP-dependent DNA helicase [Gammaproteobacteria bacterium]|nr:ATP-dependent DNA helicase [Gammaproteobacteria bacterium]
MDIDEVLGPHGLLARGVDGFAYREQQLDMAHAVADALDQARMLIAEAGTGTGKTYAYLVPVLLSGLKVIISTGTRNLQDQLFLRDLPRLREAMASPVRVALLKGRSNYLCIHRLDTALQDSRGHPAQRMRWLLQVRDWGMQTRSGDVAELGGIPEDAPIWPLVTSTTDNCLGQDCDAWSKCHLVEARRRAQEADVVVVNHHLLCADFAIRDDGFGELLPSADAYIIDEAHQLPEVASNFFGTSVSTRQVLDLGRDTRDEYLREAGDLPALPDHLDHLGKTARDLRLAFGQAARRGAWNEIERDGDIVAAIADCREALEELERLLKLVEGRGKGLDACLQRCQLLMRRLDGMTEPNADDEDIRWFETHLHSLRLNATPLDIADVFRGHMQRHPAAWVFTSATLAVGDSFEHFERQLGLIDAQTAKWDSPFDYPSQALWFVPRGLPQPNEPAYTAAVVDLVVPIIAASAGRAFLLFTSHRALREAAGLLERELEFPLLVQGDAPKAELLERFVEHGNAVLLGTSSFWEGVDVRGDALSVVVIDKLPFASPGDPVLQARLDAIRRRGGNPFMDYQVPQAAIALKQGAGRLIRDVTDRGVLVMCDPRLLKKGYGQVFLDAMPAFARTRELEQVLAFFD